MNQREQKGQADVGDDMAKLKRTLGELAATMSERYPADWLERVCTLPLAIRVGAAFIVVATLPYYGIYLVGGFYAGLSLLCMYLKRIGFGPRWAHERAALSQAEVMQISAAMRGAGLMGQPPSNGRELFLLQLVMQRRGWKG